MDLELENQTTPKGAGAWYHFVKSPNEFVEASANISVGAPHTNLSTTTTLVFNASAGTSDVATDTLILPSNFKVQTGGRDARLIHQLLIGNVSQNNSAVNNTLNAFVEYAITPGPTASSRTRFMLTEQMCTLGNTILGTTPEGWFSTYTVDIGKLCSAAQRALLVPGTLIVARVRPSATVGTNVAMVMPGTQWSWLGHFGSSFTTNTTNNV